MELPAEHALRFIATHYAGLLARHGEAFEEPVLVQPSGDFFPDDFEGDLASIGRMLERVASYAPLADDLPLAVRVVSPEGDACGPAVSCCGGSSSCAAPEIASGGGEGKPGVVELDEGGYLVTLAMRDVSHPALLGAALARAVGAIVLSEADEKITPTDAAAFAEVAAVACGLGVLLHAGAYVYGKSCGGPRVNSGTALSVEEAAVALALFARVNGVKSGEVRRHLEATQNEALEQAFEWVDSNDELVEALRVHPEAVAAGAFTLKPVRGLFGRLFKRREAAVLDAVAPPASGRARPSRTPEEQRKLEELRALVDDALGE